ANRDPALAAMILSKLRNGAMGAAGHGVPAKADQEAWLKSTEEQAGGATDWYVTRANGVVSASIVREVPPRTPASTDAPVYRLVAECNPSTRSGQILLTWSPQPQTGRSLIASTDNEPAIERRVDGRESMGNGASVQSGRASVVLSSGNRSRLSLPERSLTI